VLDDSTLKPGGASPSKEELGVSPNKEELVVDSTGCCYVRKRAEADATLAERKHLQLVLILLLGTQVSSQRTRNTADAKKENK
jgi:hypothetical protein